MWFRGDTKLRRVTYFKFTSFDLLQTIKIHDDLNWSFQDKLGIPNDLMKRLRDCFQKNLT